MEDNDLRNTVRDWFAILAFLLMLWLMGGCSSSRKVRSDRETRDSVVLRGDKETGEVLSTDTWHWKDTNKNRDHVSETRNKTEKSDSTALKSKSSVVVSKMEKTANLPKKTHYARTFTVGVVVGMLLTMMFRYRKKILGLLVKMC